MKIYSTSVAIKKNEAIKAATKQYVGLFDRVALCFQKASKKQELIINSKFIYYPLWIIGAEIKFIRPKLNPGVFYDFLAVDGCYGGVSRIVGFPNSQEVIVDEDKIIKCKITSEQAKKITIENLESKNALKYKKFPQVKVIEIQKIYKPNFVFCFEKGDKKYYRAVDAEIGTRNYFLDIKFKELSVVSE